MATPARLLAFVYKTHGPCLPPVRPRPPRRQYMSWRETGGVYEDGRHYKQFWLVDGQGGPDRLIIDAEDSHRKDRWGWL